MPRIAVVILNWNGIKLLQKFLPGVIRNSRKTGCDVYVADNGSTDGSVDWLKENFPEIKLICFPENLGFAEGYNQALEQISADYFVLLNSDVEVPEGWLDPLVLFMEEHPEAGACSPTILSLDQKESFEYAGAAGGFLDYLGFPFCRGRIFHVTETDRGQYSDTMQVFWASGACFMVRSDVYFKAGGLDPDFFAHMEEIDLSWRIQCLGYRIYSVSKSHVYHLGGGSLSMGNPRKTYLNFRNNLFLLLKNLPGRRLWLILPIRMILDGIAGLRFLARGEFRNFSAVLHAHGSFYRKFRTMYRKRKQIPRCKVLPETFYQRLITWDFYVKKITVFKELPMKPD